MCVISLMLKNDIFYKSLQWPAQGLHDGKCMTMTGGGMARIRNQKHNKQPPKQDIENCKKRILDITPVLLFWISVSTESFILFSKVHSCHLQRCCDHVTPLTGIFSEHLAHDRIAWWLIDSLETKAISSQMAPAPAPGAAPHRGLERRSAAAGREDDRTGGGPRLWRSGGRRLY